MGKGPEVENYALHLGNNAGEARTRGGGRGCNDVREVGKGLIKEGLWDLGSVGG